MRQHLTWPHFHSLHRPSAPARGAPPARRSHPRLHPQGECWQEFKDKLAVAAVLLLVLATATVFVLYLVQQAPHFGAGEFTGFATPAPGVIQESASAAPGATATTGAAGTGLGRIPLILISTVVEMAIFVALGLYLRHDIKRKP